MLKSILVLALAPTAIHAQEFTGEIKRLDPAFDKLVAPEAKIEKLAEGFQWAEGPVWDAAKDRVLFSDVPQNTVFAWSEKDGLTTFLKPSGFTGPEVKSREPGSNGLAFDARGRLLSCEHGDRRVSVLTETGGKMTLADNYEGKRLNSPNDLVVHSSGDIFFTDPPYGLPGGDQSEFRELDHFGVYRIDPDGGTTLLVADLPRPNGVTLSPDEKTLYVAQSHGPAPHVMAYPLDEKLATGEGRVLFDASELAKELPGMPDGLKCDQDGNIWSTGPGGVMVISPEGKLLGRILTGDLTANVNWGGDGSVLYMTVNHQLMRLSTTTKGAGWK